VNNYPDGMDFIAFDDYYDPKLKCGHRSSDYCECWCDGGEYESAHMNDNCNGDNCRHLQCQSCFAPTDEVEYTVDNLQRQNPQGKLLWVVGNKPLRFIPQNQLLIARLCAQCKSEYDEECRAGKLILCG